MAIANGDKQNFETLLNAAKHDDLALLECQDINTGENRSVLCAVNRSQDGFEFIPLAKLFTVNPYDELRPPT